jgi:hypothetical protein
MPPARDPLRVKVKVKKKAAPSPVFGPLGRADAGLKKAQHQAHAKTQRAQRKVEARTVVPYVPKLKHPTPAQRGAAVSQVAQSLHKQGITKPSQVKALPKAQRVRVNRAIGYANTNRKLVASMPSNVRDRAQILPGKPHKHVGIPGVASIDLTATSRAISKKLAGNQIAAVLKAVPEAAKLTAKQKGVIGLAGRGLQDAIDLPANTITSSYLVGKEAATGHPGKAAKMLYEPIKQTVEHPAKSFSQHPLNTVLIGRGIKGAVGHSTGRVLRTGVAGTTLKKAASVERTAKTLPNARVTTQRRYSGDPSAKLVQVAHEKVKVRRAAKKGKPHPDTMTARDIRQRVNEEVQAAKIVSSQNEGHAARQAKKAIGRKPNAAVTLAAKGVTNATRLDLENYLKEIRAQHPHLGTEAERKANEHLQTQIVAALKHHNEEAVQTAARAYSDLRQPVEAQVVEHQLVNPVRAEETRFAGPAVRQGASVASKKTAVAAGKQAREDARRVKVRARQDVAKADQNVQGALADARVSNVRSKSSPALKAAEKERDQAVAHLAALKRKGLSESNREVQRAEAIARKASARLTSQAERERGVAQRAEATAKGRAAVLSRNVGGKAGGHGIELAQAAVDRAVAKVRKSRGGVPPAEADALRRALAARDEAVVAHAASVRGARATVRQAEARVKAEQGRIGGVHPKEADRLLNALAERDTIRVRRSQAVQGHKAATAAHRESKNAPFADENLQPVTVAKVRAKRGEGAIEPAFVTESPIARRSAALPSEKPSIPVREMRTGEAVRKGTFDAHPATLIEQAMASSRLVDAAKAREKFIEDFGYRDTPKADVSRSRRARQPSSTPPRRRTPRASTGPRCSARTAPTPSSRMRRSSS